MAASSREHNAKRSRSDALATAMAIPHGGETANNDINPGVNTPNITSEQFGMKADDSRTNVDATKSERIVKLAMRLHLYSAAVLECLRNPSLQPVVFTSIICQLLFDGCSLERFLFFMFVSCADGAEALSLRLAVSLLLAMSMTEAAVLWVKFKSLHINDVLLVIPVVISCCVMKN